MARNLRNIVTDRANHELVLFLYEILVLIIVLTKVLVDILEI